MSARVDVFGILERAGADRDAAEGTQAWALAQVCGATAALIEASRRAECKLSAYVGVCRGDKELTDAILPMLRDALALCGGAR